MTVIKTQITSWDGVESRDSIEYRISYLVTTNDRSDGPSVVKASLPVTLDDAYSSGNDFDIDALLVSVSVTQVDPANFYDWNVDCVYKSTELRTNPLLEPIQESVTWNGVEIETDKYYDGSYIVNTAGMLLDDPATKIDNRPVITYSLNQLVFPFSLAAQVRNSVNSTLWKGFAPRTIKISSMGTERVFDGKFGIYYRVSYTFEHNPETYDFSSLSLGWYSLVDKLASPEIAEDLAKGQRFVPAKPARTELEAITLNGKWFNAPSGLKADGSVALVPADIATVSGALYEPLDYNILFPFLV